MRKFSSAFALVLLLLSTAAGPRAVLAAGIKDSESASHGNEAAGYQLIKTYKGPGFEILQFNLAVLSHYSYILISDGQALVVDPGRDIDRYLEVIRERKLKVKGVYLTHSHADFVAGHMEMNKALAVPIYANEKSRVGFKHIAIREGFVIEVGNVGVRILETPGHTPDGTCGLVEVAGKPQMLFTGDTLFVGSVGRPDLLEGTMSAAKLASMGYDTWKNKLSRLPDEVVVLPAHGAGSLCGAHLRDEPSSTIGEERSSNPYLQKKSRSEFVAPVIDDLPEAPQYFAHNAAMNRKGPALVDWKSAPTKEPLNKVLADPAKNYVVDLRDAAAYAAGHIPNSVNIGLRGRLETWTGIMVPWGSKLVLVGSPAELTEAVRRLPRIGYRASVVDISDWKKAGLPLVTSERVKPRDLHAAIKAGKGPVVVDVRLPKEWMALRIGVSLVNLPINKLGDMSAKLDPSQPVVTVCNSAYRSSMAVGLLERKGFRKVGSMDGGGEAWIEAGLPVFEATKGGASGARKIVSLPDRISPAGLKRMLKDLPGTFDLVDIRPAKQFADYSLPGSRNVDIGEVLAGPAFLTGAGPLVLVDRDGSLAMAVGGVLCQKTKRQIKVLHGGLEAYWKESRLPAGGTGSGKSAVPPPPPPTAAPAPAPADRPKPPRKKSAGC